MESELPLYTDDIVTRSEDDAILGVVDRTDHDVDTHLPFPGRAEPDIIRNKNISKRDFKKFMKEGVPPPDTVLVRWDTQGPPELIPQANLKLLDRSLLIGDVVKRNVKDFMSGVVINTFTTCMLHPVCDLKLNDRLDIKGIASQIPLIDAAISLPPSGRPALITDVPVSELMTTNLFVDDDLVIYRNWLGRIVAPQQAITIRLTDNCVVEVMDDDLNLPAESSESWCVSDIVSTKKGNLRAGRWIFGKYNPNTPPVGTVVETRTVSADVVWLQRRIGSTDDVEPPSPLEREDFESSDCHVYDRTKIPANALQLESHLVSNSHFDARLGARVRFRDLAGACVKYDGSGSNGKVTRLERKDNLGYDLNVFEIGRFQTDVTVQWQDLSVSKEHSNCLVPDASIDDEHAAWPGEVVHTLDLQPVPDLVGIQQPGRVGIVHSVNASERMAKVQWCPNSCMQYAVEDEEPSAVRSLLTGAVGIAEGELEETSLYDVEASAIMNVRRGDIVLIAKRGWTSAGLPGSTGDVDWLGEVVDTKLDGSLTIRLGAAFEVRDVNLLREDVVVAVRSDGTNDYDDWDEEGFTEELEYDFENASIEAVDSHPDDVSEDWYMDSEEDEEGQARYEDENGMPMDEDEAENEEWESDDSVDKDGDSKMHDMPQESPETVPDISRRKDEASSTDETPDNTLNAPEPYLILDTPVPLSHPFSTQSPSDTLVHMKRTQKEHKILRSPSNLPKGVFVRTWEARLDLLRVLIVGPAETPYADASFVMDFCLPQNFPVDPPLAYFHSWPPEIGVSAVGRVNPNLYEDGKICLSLLGTWQGTQGEGWSASRSTLLQVIVSLLGLVLVREPYFNEAGYEPLAGLESSKRPSALYNERTLMRARTFIITALKKRDSSTSPAGAPGLEGLEDVIFWLYRSANGPGLLDKTIKDVEKVLQNSEAGGEPDGLTIMSKGACIPLKRLLERLRSLQ